MYSYDRRRASAHARDYTHALDQAVKAHGVKHGHERKVAEAKRIARELDAEVKHHKALNPDEAWSQPRTKLEKLWKDLQKLFSYCFGFDPPTLAKMGVGDA